MIKAKTKLNAWLLISVHNFDDVPVRLFDSREQAARWLQKNHDKPVGNDVLGTMDITEPLGWKLLEFKDGKPKGTADIIKWNDQSDGHERVPGGGAPE